VSEASLGLNFASRLGALARSQVASCVAWVAILTVAVLSVAPPRVVASWLAPREIRLAPPYLYLEGAAYTATAPAGLASDNAVNPRASVVLLLEDGMPLAPPHSLNLDVEQTGHGAYNHWGQQITFSTSDNSDPNTNGRVYSIRFPASVPPQMLVPLYLGFAGLIAALVTWAGPRLQRLVRSNRC
jgi:hypothetical protein